jgi:PD-(D/E)XK nuclease superfamily
MHLLSPNSSATLTSPHEDATEHILRPILHADGSLHWSNSSAESYITCDRKGKYRLVDRRIGARNKRSLTLGQGVHRCLEKFRLGEGNANLYSDILNAAVEGDGITDDWRTPDYALELVFGYLEQFGKDDLVQTQLADRPAIECVMSTELGSVTVDPFDFRLDSGDTIKVHHVPVHWHSVIDRIVRREDGLFVQDYKTTSVLGPQYYDQFPMSGQQIGYTHASSNLLGEPVMGSIIDVLCWRKPTKTGKGREYARHVQRYSPDRIDEWIHNTLDLAHRFVDALRTSSFPMRTTQCQTKYGKCDYFDVCSLSAATRAGALRSSLFVDNLQVVREEAE